MGQSYSIAPPKVKAPISEGLDSVDIFQGSFPGICEIQAAVLVYADQPAGLQLTTRHLFNGFTSGEIPQVLPHFRTHVGDDDVRF